MSARTRRLVGALAILVVLAVALGACSSQKTSQLVGKTWQLASIAERTPQYEATIPADQQANYTIAFKDDGTASIKADCNTVGATWKEGNGASITITPTNSTAAACGPDSKGDQFVRALGKTVSYGVVSGSLKLTMNDAGELAFTAAP